MFNEREIIDGELFETLMLAGAANLKANLQTINDLNVFPVPDGDTGDNMYLTLKGGVTELANAGGTLSEKAKAVAQGMLLGARGNSGVILSQIFFGISEGLSALQEASLIEFCTALKEGVNYAYKAVAKPVEGTILTVAREAAEAVIERQEGYQTAEELFVDYLSEMKKSLEGTPEKLAVLKEAGVVDSGGAGLVCIVEGFCKAICGEEIVGGEIAATENAQVDFSKFDENAVMQFGYCTELLLRLQTAKTDVENFSVEPLVAFLNEIGDSVVAVKTGSVVKIHVHTLSPWKVLEYCQRYGEYLTVKIENMTLQHGGAKEEEKVKKAVKPHKKYAVVTVAAGEGLKAMFTDMGADEVVDGGQTNNPSAEDFLRAFDEVNADTIFVLPNNGNIVMAAKQAAGMYEGSRVIVVESKNVGEGYSALSAVDFELDDADEIAMQMAESMAETKTGMVARAVRDADLNGVAVRKDCYMGFTDKLMLLCEKTRTDAAVKLAETLGVADKEFLIAIYGEGVTDEEKKAFVARLEGEYGDLEVFGIDGGQEVYDFLLILE